LGDVPVLLSACQNAALEVLCGKVHCHHSKYTYLAYIWSLLLLLLQTSENS
jgi:hypothetical protein